MFFRSTPEKYDSTGLMSTDEANSHWVQEDFTPILDKKLIKDTPDGDVYDHLFTPRQLVRNGSPSPARFTIRVPARKLDYVYKPLAHADSQIRVMHLLPGGKQDLLKCTISSQDFATCPPYICLSYVWGSPIGTNPMIVEDSEGGSRAIGVTQNLMMALYHIRKPNKTVVLWADAICIDQSNDQEKGHQVKMMTEIYRKAEGLISWLGPAQDDSKRVMHFIRALAFASANIFYEWDQSPKTRRRLIWALKKINWVDLRPIFDSSYWTRAWIVQEVAVRSHYKSVLQLYYKNRFGISYAKSLWRILYNSKRGFSRDYLLYGPHKITFGAIVSISRMLTETRFESDITPVLYSRITTRDAYGKNNPPSTGDGRIRSLVTARSENFINQILRCFPTPNNFTEAYIGACLGLQATQPRDRLYALSGIYSSYNIVPDYSKSEAEVELDVATILVQSSKAVPVSTIFLFENYSLDQTRAVETGSSETFISWVPYGNKNVYPLKFYADYFQVRLFSTFQGKRTDRFNDAEFIRSKRQLKLKLLYKSRIVSIWPRHMQRIDFKWLRAAFSRRFWPFRHNLKRLEDLWFWIHNKKPGPDSISQIQWFLDPDKLWEDQIETLGTCNVDHERSLIDTLADVPLSCHQIALLEDGNLVLTCSYARLGDDAVLIKGLRVCTILRQQEQADQFIYVESAVLVGVPQSELIGEEVGAILI